MESESGARSYLLASGTIFGVIGLLHLLRALFGISVRAESWEFPIGLSWVGGAAALALCLWAFRLRRAQRPRAGGR